MSSPFKQLDTVTAAGEGDGKQMCTLGASVVEASLVRVIDNVWSRNARFSSPQIGKLTCFLKQ